MRLLDKLTSKLKCEVHVHFLLRLHFFFLRVDNQIEASHKKLIGSFGQAGDCSRNDEHSPCHLLAPTRQNQAGGIGPGVPSTSEKSSLTESVRTSSIWRNFPKPIPCTKYYGRLSTYWLTYTVVRALFRNQLVKLLSIIAKPFTSLRPNCLLLGRFVIHPSISEMSSVLLPIYHLLWRFNILVAERFYKLTMVDFLFLSDEDTRQFYAGLRGKAVALKQAKKSSSIGDRLLAHAMCYQVHKGGRIQFRLRPNRTPEARSQLSDQVIKSFIVCTVTFLMLLVGFTSYITVIVLSDRYYVLTYPGCFRELDERAARNELPFWSLTMNDHRIVSTVVDGIENVVLWLDCALAMIYGPTFCYLLNYDLLLYWSDIQANLESLLQRVRYNNLSRSNSRAFSPNTSISRRSIVLGKLKYYDQFSNEQFNALSSRWGPPDRFTCNQLDDEICEARFKMLDFFTEVGRVDLLVSDILTMAIITWLSFSAMIGNTYISATHRTTIPVIIKCIIISGFSVFVSATFLLLTLRRRCLLTYKTMCSLMANHSSHEKRHLTKVLEFFTRINRTTYTLVHHYPYQPTTFISIIGYTFSCVLLAITFMSRSKQGRLEVVHEDSSVKWDWI